MERLEELAREFEARPTRLEKLPRIDLFAPHSSQAL